MKRSCAPPRIRRTGARYCGSLCPPALTPIACRRHTTEIRDVVYDHPYLGPWRPRLRRLWFDPIQQKNCEVTEGFAYPLSTDLDPTNLKRRRFTWLQLKEQRDAVRQSFVEQGRQRMIW